MGRNITVDQVETMEENASTGGNFSLLKQGKLPILNNKSLSEMAGDKTQLKLKIDSMLFSVTKEGHKVVKPTDENNVWYYREYKKHSIDRKTMICPTTFGLPCPICEKEREEKNKHNCYVKGVQASLPKPLQDYIRSLGAKSVYLYPVMVKGELYLLDISYGNLQKALDKAIKNAPMNVGKKFFLDSKGNTARVTLDLASFGGNNYWEAVLVDFEDEDRADIPAAMIDAVEAENIDSLIEPATFEECKDALSKLTMDEDPEMMDDEEDDDTPALVSAASRRGAQPAPVAETAAPVVPVSAQETAPAAGFSDQVITDDDF